MSAAIVVAGARGFVGQHLVDRLLADGRPVRCGTRSPDRAREQQPDRDWVALDLDAPDTLPDALAGADALVYLVHGLGQSGGGLHEREQQQARAVRDACEAAGVRRIVYLGGPVPGHATSAHLEARRATGEALRGGTVSCIELRAAMVVGAGSESWKICRDLAMRLPVMIAPSWTDSRMQPVGIGDVVTALVAALDDPEAGSAAHDLPGPECLTAVEILRRVAVHAGIRTVVMPVPLLTPRLSSLWLRFVTGADYTIARQLVDGLAEDLVLEVPGYWAHLGLEGAPTPLDDAIARALEEEAPPGGAGRTLEQIARRVGVRARPPGPGAGSSERTGSEDA